MIKDNNAITLTMVSIMTANYGESLGNISTIQKVIKDGKTYGKRSKENINYFIKTEAGFYDDGEVEIDGAAQKKVNEKMNISNCKSLESGYMGTKGKMFKRTRSVYVSDGISVEPFTNDYEFHNNLGLATKYAKQNNLSVTKDASKCGLMPYNYEYQRDKMIYSVTIDLNRFGIDENFDVNIPNEEKIERIVALLESIQNLSLVVKGSMDNACPLFIIGGFSKFKTHVFEPFIKVKDNQLIVTDSLIQKLKSNEDCAIGMIDETFDNDKEIKEKLNVKNVDDFFDELIEKVKEYYS